MFVSPAEAVVHTLAVALSVVVLAISVIALRKRRERRYLFLAVAFLFLCLSQSVEFLESYYSTGSWLLPLLNVHPSHLLDLTMFVFFGLALLR